MSRPDGDRRGVGGYRRLPLLIRFLLRHLALGSAAGFVFGYLLLRFNVAGLGGLMAGPGGGALPLFLYFFGLVVTFGSVAMGIAVMGLGRPRN